MHIPFHLDTDFRDRHKCRYERDETLFVWSIFGLRLSWQSLQCIVLLQHFHICSCQTCQWWSLQRKNWRWLLLRFCSCGIFSLGEVVTPARLYSLFYSFNRCMYIVYTVYTLGHFHLLLVRIATYFPQFTNVYFHVLIPNNWMGYHSVTSL